jgi:hypothetical protein
MARLEGRDLLFWSVPAAVAAVAAFFAFRAFQRDEWVPPKDAPELAFVDPCAVGRYRCRKNRVETTTGERGDGGPLSCAYREIGACSRACVNERVSLAGVDDATAKAQLCNLPKRPLLLLSKTESYLDAPYADAGTCEGDGYVPTPEGFVQCILRSSKDPGLAGVVLGRSFCKVGAVNTLDRTPQLIPREEAAALWCRRDPAADAAEPDAGAPTVADGGAPDAPAGAASIGDAVPRPAASSSSGAPSAPPSAAATAAPSSSVASGAPPSAAAPSLVGKDGG